MDTPFDAAVTEHGQTVLRVCRAVLGSGMDADDAWSETFLAALKSWPELDNDTNVEAWLVRVARNKSIDIIRRNGREREKAHGASASNASQPDIWDVVSALPPRQREAISYHYLGGLSHAETAELTGSNAVAVRRAAADGMKTLRKVFHDESL